MPLVPGAEPFAQEGNRTGILLLHGFTGSPKSMRPWAEHLAACGYTVSVPRLPGHGTKWQDMNVTTWEDWYAEAERAFTSLTKSCDRVFVFGLSMGGSLTLRLAETQGNAIAGVALVNPAVHSERPDRHLLPAISKLIGSFPGVSNDIKKPGQDEAAYNRLPLKAAHSMTKLWARIKDDIAKVNQPLLLFRSVDDHVVEPSNAAWILAHVSSSDATEVVLENSYHVATLDNDAPLIFDTSVAFVERLGG